jgi:amphi-Trp domain-containing protein
VDLIEHNESSRLQREAAADRLRAIADELSRHNEISFVREGIRHTVRVADEVELSVEIEVGDDKSEIEIEITW